MRDFLLELFRNDRGPIIEMYNWVHILFLVVIVGSIIGLYFIFRNKETKTKQLLLKILAIIIVGLYLTDFLVHPFLNGGNDYLIVDKLPYHICTASAVLIAIVNIFPNHTKHIKTAVAVLGLIGAFYYIFIPSGVTGDGYYAFSYKELQTFLYHGCLLAYGVLSILLEDIVLDIKKVWVEMIIIVSLILISLGANAAYADSSKGVHYDWFFTTGSSFGISSTVMPFIVFAVFAGTTLIIYGINYLVKFIKNRK